MWVVMAYGVNGTIFTYSVDAPPTSSPMDVACSAYALHGKRVRSGEEREYLGPDHTVEWLGEAA
jgi:hypothetical protein